MHAFGTLDALDAFGALDASHELDALDARDACIVYTGCMQSAPKYQPTLKGKLNKTNKFKRKTTLKTHTKTLRLPKNKIKTISK